MRHKKKHNPRPKRRTTLLRLAAVRIAIALVLTAAFAVVFTIFTKTQINSNMETNCLELNNALERSILKSEKNGTTKMSRIDVNFAMSGEYYGGVNEFLSQKFIYSNVTPGCACGIFLFDSEGNVVSSNRRKLISIIKEDLETKDQYVCDDLDCDIPEVRELFERYEKMMEEGDDSAAVEIKLESAYINRKTGKFIPRKGIMSLVEWDDPYGIDSAMHTVRSEEIDFDCHVEGYEILDLKTGDDLEFTDVPRASLTRFMGSPVDRYEKVYEKLKGDAGFTADYKYNVWERFGEIFTCGFLRYVKIGGSEYELWTVFMVNDEAPVVVEYIALYTLLVMAVLVLIALVLAWARNASNKAQYAFEDYQRTLINNLAHDMKTPLTAIGGYAENAKRSLEKGNTEDAAKYLSAINENVFYTDTIVERTLELNRTTGKTDIKRETLELRKMAEKALEKYALMLEEKDITVSVTGEFTLSADRGSMTAAVENLISNAVKFTPEHGKIDITADKNSLTVTNDITEDIDTADLTLPFIKGGRTADHPSGSGLGLAIVSGSADANGLKTEITCRNKKFTAKLKN